MNLRIAPQLTALAVALFTAGIAYGQVPPPKEPVQAPPAHKDVPPAEIRYQAGSSKIATVDMHQNINPQAPPMNRGEFDKVKQVYF